MTLLMLIVEEFIINQSGKIAIKDIDDMLLKSADPNIIIDGTSVLTILDKPESTSNMKNLEKITKTFLLNGRLNFDGMTKDGVLAEIVKKQRGMYRAIQITKAACVSPEYRFNDVTYCFDGEFVVAKFSAGTKLYHGSFPLGNAASSFPVGRAFYEPGYGDDIVELRRAAASEYTIEELLTEQYSISPSWFAVNQADAMNYIDKTRADCCMNTYRIKRDCVLFLLSSDYNIYKLLTSKSVDEDVKKSLRSMFTINQTDTLELENSDNPLESTLKITTRSKSPKQKIRASAYDQDRNFANFVCEFFYGKYAGYYAPVLEMNDGKIFHSEVVLCNSILYLSRDVDDQLDLFFDPRRYCDSGMPAVCTLLTQMRLYETTNTNFHSGNLLEHSIWTLLFAESLTNKLINDRNRSTDALTDREKKIIIAAALVHDIGKLDPQHCEKNAIRNRYIYYDLKDHPKIGATYFETGIPILDDNLEISGSLSPRDILREMVPEITDDEIGVIREVVRIHWLFSYDVIRLVQSGDKELPQAIDKYTSNFREMKNPVFAAIATMIVSISDVEASQPFTELKLNDVKTQNDIYSILHSKIFPSITSKPKIYKGGNLASKIKVRDNGIIAMNLVLENLQSKK